MIYLCVLNEQQVFFQTFHELFPHVLGRLSNFLFYLVCAQWGTLGTVVVVFWVGKLHRVTSHAKPCGRNLTENPQQYSMIDQVLILERKRSGDQTSADSKTAGEQKLHDEVGLEVRRLSIQELHHVRSSRGVNQGKMLVSEEDSALLTIPLKPVKSDAEDVKSPLADASFSRVH